MEFNLAKFNKIVDEGEQMGFTITRAQNPDGIIVSFDDSEFSNFYKLDGFNWKLCIQDFGATCFNEGKHD